ncbi:hypothetical protein AAF712_000405 [Marasmius tenuissimus]|uniref:GH16 domain-containing protein n=1 Tax=Marasmius tenuissimus TaxID=585030 RepID=A0ABR3AJ92_9AGAR|nr:hypothetical protein PM082_001213 [Marasmius tenuissimus]
MTPRLYFLPFLLVPTLFPGFASATSYSLVRDYSGATFFNGWKFYGAADNLTNGDANFVSQSQASSLQLAYVDPNTQRAIIKVDNTSVVAFNEKRNTVRISTEDLYPVGSVWVADMHHVPFGCSVWPAWWSQAPGWPTGGEIDTFEGVNMVTQNQISLHTTTGCNQVNPVQSSTQISSTNCSNLANQNQGCITMDPDPKSYGQGFADADGGVFVTEMAKSGVSIWFFSRANVPSSLSTNASTVDTSTLGTPLANYPTGGCNIDQFFSPQSLILDITLCGDFARPTFNQTCSSLAKRDNSCYLDVVLGPPSGYDTAFFDIAYVRVYGSGGSSENNGNQTSSSGGSQTGSSGGNSAVGLKHAQGVGSLVFMLAAVQLIASL